MRIHLPHAFLLLAISAAVLAGCGGSPSSSGGGTIDGGVGPGGVNFGTIELRVDPGAEFTSKTEVGVQILADLAQDMFITFDPQCHTGGVWERYRRSMRWPLRHRNAENRMYLRLRILTTESVCLEVPVVTHDDIPPVVTIAPAAPGVSVFTQSTGEFVVKGTCESGRGSGTEILIEEPVQVQTVCEAGAWQAKLPLTDLPDGAFVVKATQKDLAGNLGTASGRFVNETRPPDAPTLAFVNGTLEATSALNLAMAVGVGARTSEIKLSVGESCQGGAWQAPVTSYTWALATRNAVNHLSVLARNSAGRESACATVRVIHDDIAPVWSSAPRLTARWNDLGRSPEISFDKTAVDANPVVYQYALGRTDRTPGDLRDWTTISASPFRAEGLSLRDAERVYLFMRAKDGAGQSSLPISASWLVDVTPPLVMVDEPALDEPIPGRELFLRGRCEGVLPVRLRPDAQTQVASEIPCVGERFEARVTTGASAGPRVISLSQSDGLQDGTTEARFRVVRPMQLDGPVLAIAPSPDGGTYLGGDFHHVVNQTALGVLLSDEKGTRSPTFEMGSGFNGIVRASVRLPDGSYVMAGDFTSYRGRPAMRVARVSPDGQLDEEFSPSSGANGASGSVRTILLSGDSLYLGGDFTRYRDVSAARLVRIDFDGSLLKGFHEKGGFGNGSVLTLRESKGVLYVGGSFTSYRGRPAMRLAKLGAIDGELDRTFSPATGPNGASGSVRALLVESDGNLVVGGDFTSIRDRGAARLARIRADGEFLANFGSGFNDAVESLTFWGDDLVVGGAFSQFDGREAKRLVRLHSSGQRDDGFLPVAEGFDGSVSALAVLSDSLWVGGNFTSYRGQKALRVARVFADGHLDSAYAASEAGGVSSAVHGVSAYAGEILWSGAFMATASDRPVQGLLKVSATGDVDERFQPADRPGVNGTVRALLATSDGLFVGGSFDSYRGQAVGALLKLHHDGALDGTFHSHREGVRGEVRALAMQQDFVVVGGRFSSYRGESTANLMSVAGKDGELVRWERAGTGFDGDVHALVVDGDHVFAGGSFEHYSGHVANRIARVDGRDGALDFSFSPSKGANGFDSDAASISGLAFAEESLFAVGKFATYRGERVEGLAKISRDGRLDTKFHDGSTTAGFIGHPRAIAIEKDRVFVTGSFTSYRGRLASGVVALDLASGDVDSRFPSDRTFEGPAAAGLCLSQSSSQLLLGGDFRSFGGRSWMSFVRLRSDSGQIIGGLQGP